MSSVDQVVAADGPHDAQHTFRAPSPALITRTPSPTQIKPPKSPLIRAFSHSPAPSVAPADDVHFCSLADLESRLATHVASGLTNADAQERLLTNGRNILSKPPVHWFRNTMRYLFGGFCWLLWIAAIVTFIAWKPLGEPNPAVANLALAILLLIVILSQAVFGAWQDWTSSRVMSRIESMLPRVATVQREGAWRQVPLAELVVGDVVLLKYGNKSPADLRMVSVKGLKVDASIVTGEAVPVEVTVDQTSDVVAESRNIVLMGSGAVEGEGVGVVFATGDHTLMGRVAKLATSSGQAMTILQMEISRFVNIIAALAVATAVICMIIWATWLRVDYPGFLTLSAMLSNDMGVLVAYVPEGLPIAVTLILLIIAQRMRRQRILVKSLTTVETLGCVNLICSDKTGTLTTNMMTVSTVAIGSTASAVGFGEELPHGTAGQQLLVAARICNGAAFDAADASLPIDSRRVNGDATDAALLRFAHRSTHAGQTFHKRQEVPFSSKAKWMAVVAEPAADSVATNIFAPGSDGPLLLVKGAPDVLVRHCTHYVTFGEQGLVAPFDEAARTALTGIQEQWSRNGQRVLLLAFRPVENGEIKTFPDHAAMAPLLHDLVVIGLVGIVDPPRPEASTIVETCRRAGMRFFMITGDFSLTGEAIARSVAIVTAPNTHHFEDLGTLTAGASNDVAVGGSAGNVELGLMGDKAQNTALVLTGSDVARLTQEQWDAIGHYTEVVFARTSPEQKLTIVKEMQARGCIVAVTGDGVNDAAALKQAHIGVAMGSGSDVAMESAAMVLLDSNLGSIVESVRQGRTVFDNLKKVCLYLLPAGSFSELTPVLVNLFFGVPLPLCGFLMIFICVITDLGPALSLMFEQGESDLLRRAPRRPKQDPLVDFKLLLHAYLFIGIIESVFAHVFYFLYMRREWGVSTEQLLFAFDSWGVDGYAGLTAEEQMTANATGQLVYFIALVVMQLGNLLATRTRHQSLFSHSPLRNPALFVGMAVELVLAIAVVYGPAFKTLLGATTVPAEYWFLPLPCAFLIVILDELRKLATRRYPHSWLATIAW